MADEITYQMSTLVQAWPLKLLLVKSSFEDANTISQISKLFLVYTSKQKVLD